MRRGAAALVFLLAAGSPAIGYEEDTHYYLCYVMARMGGLDDRDARVVASAAQGVDEAPGTTPLRWRNFVTKSDELDRLKRVLPLWHAMSLSGDEAEIAARMAKIRDDAFRGKGNLIGLGQFAHFAQDWYSHQPEKARHYRAPIGHFWDRHAPDYLGTDSRKAEEMARKWMKEVAAFVEATGRAPAAPPGDVDQVLRKTLAKLIWAHRNELSHEETERELNDLFKGLGIDLAVPAYDARLVYSFDEDGTPHAVDVDRDLPPLVVRLDAASRRVMDRAQEEAAAAGKILADPAGAALRALEALESARLDELALSLHEARLAAMRRRIKELRAELDELEKEMKGLEAEIEKLTNVNKGPCICGAATHAQCKKGKECQDVERAMGEKLIEQLRPKKGRRREILDELEALAKKAEAEAAAAQALRARQAGEPPAGLEDILAPGVALTPRLRAAIPRLLPYLPRGVIITSGYRSPEKQLQVLRVLARRNQVPWREEATVDRPETWTEAWHALLAKGVIVNPPAPAKRPDGTLAQGTPHAKGHSVDIAGAPLAKIEAALKKARADEVVVLPQIKPEPRNGCVHVQFGE